MELVLIPHSDAFPSWHMHYFAAPLSRGEGFDHGFFFLKVLGVLVLAA
jgi:hypothetical protein